jgi:hypothetical protein
LNESSQSESCLGEIILNGYIIRKPVGRSPTATNAQDPVTLERGGPSPYRAVEPWLLLLLYNIIYYYIIL